jgi:hypothetical protein
MAAIAAMRHDPVIRAFYERLVARRQALEGRDRGVHAPAAHHPQRDAARSDCVERSATHPPGGEYLTFKTVAIPSLGSSIARVA